VFANAAKLGYQVGWSGDSAEDLKKTYDALLAGGLRDEIATDRKELDTVEATRAQLEHCGETQAKPACSVKVLYLYQVLRGFPPQQVFAQTLLGFELASVDPRVVGMNFVMPEDGYLSMRDYHLHMRMLDYLHSIYPKVRMTLHAGELSPGMVPPEGLKFHIREAVELGHAERIGHGVDVMYEDRPHELLQELAAKHIMVEINLTSNDVILGIKGKDNPLSLYRAAHVPLALSTDDEGVSRIDITHEYEKAVSRSRASATWTSRTWPVPRWNTHSFPVKVCGPRRITSPGANQRVPGRLRPESNPASACAALLKSSDRAAAAMGTGTPFGGI
jgi:adenosine deaminase